MPEIKVQHVVSFSSQDKNNPADNLLRADGTHKWKCSTAGEKSVSVVLQFEKASQIHSIDIGNEGSAFVEILVGRSSASSDADYKVLLVASAFMSPLEARNNTNRNSVRMFSGDKLSKTVTGEKWDRVKIVCTQPFNKTNTFGLSFIKFHSPPDPSEKDSKPAQKTLGFFKMKAGDEGDLHAGSLFEHRGKPATTPPPLSGAAAVREASKLAEDSRPTLSTSAVGGRKNPATTSAVKPPSSEPVVKSEKNGAAAVRAASKLAEDSRPTPSTSAVGDRKSPAATTSAVKPSSSEPVVKPERTVETKKKEVKSIPSPAQNREKRKHNVSDDNTDEDIGPPTKTPLRKQPTSLSSTSSKASSGKEEKPHPLKKHRSEPPKESPAKSFSRIMEKVVFAMSGFQNPYRAELRDRATAMGAVYKPDWGKGCTHLICAFPNTPKYNQVKGRGKIVNQKWIQDCYKQKKLLPWRKFRVGDAESPSEESSSEEEYNPTPKKPTPKKTPTKKASPPPKAVKYESSDDDAMYGGATDSGEDTEDELRKAKASMSKKSPNKSKSKVTNDDFDPYGADTDEDKPGPSNKGANQGSSTVDDGFDSGLPDLPDFFTDKKFFFYGKLDNKDRRLLTRYITAYDGEVEDYMSDKINYVVTSSPWDENFDETLSDNPGLVFVKPKWIHVCHDKSKLMPHQPYIVVPDS